MTGALFIVGIIAVSAWVLRPHIAFLAGIATVRTCYGGEHEEMSEVVNEDLADQRLTLKHLHDERASFFANMAFTPTAEAQQFQR